MKNKVNLGPASSKKKGERAKDLRKEKEMKALEHAQKADKILSSKHSSQHKTPKRTSGVAQTLSETFDFIPHKVDYTWKPHSFNTTKQKIEYFQKFCFKYRVPSILILEAAAGRRDAVNYSRHILQLIAGKGSFYKKVSNVFTKKEAHYFLMGSNNKSFFHLFYEAKTKARDLPVGLRSMITEVFIDKFNTHLERFTEFSSLGQTRRAEKVIDFLDFITRNKDYAWTKNEIADMADFVRYEVLPDAHTDHTNFTFVGRTIGSVSKIVNDWHADFNRRHQGAQVGNVTRYQAPPSWDGYRVENLDADIKGNNQGESYHYRIAQLTTSDGIFREGRTMHHCVGSYVNSAAQGECAIFSVTRVKQGKNGGDIEHVATVELKKGSYGFSIAQMRAKCNAQVDPLTKSVIERWKREKA